jgi:large subunit ribosomal protein L25
LADLGIFGVIKMTDFVVDAVAREDQGKGASRRLRLQNLIPAVVYGGEGEPQSISLSHFKIIKALEDEAFYSSIITLNVDGKEQEVVLKDLQRHPFKALIMHADFMRITRGQPMKATVPLHFINEAECLGVKAGGSVARNVSDVEINVLPRNLPEYIAVDLTNLEIGDTLHLSDLPLPESAEIIALTHGEDHDLPVVTVNAAKVVVDEDLDAPVVDAGEVPSAAGSSDDDATAE